jgi:hypothetical protein
MPPHPSPTYERLRHTIAERMRMSHIDQPLMLMELLGRGFARQQPAPPWRKTSPSGSWETDGGPRAQRQRHHPLRRWALQPDRRG